MIAEPQLPKASAPFDARASRGEPAPEGAGRLGLYLFLASLSMLFAASLTGYIVIRLRAEEWPPAGMPALPAGLWVSTAIILLTSVTAQWAVAAARRERMAAARNALLATSVLSVLFLVNQVLSWRGLLAVQLTPRTNLYGFTFYILTGLHGLHVIGGLVVLGWVTVRAYLGHYTAAFHPGVSYAAIYIHFLDVVWLIMFGVMYLFA